MEIKSHSDKNDHGYPCPVPWGKPNRAFAGKSTNKEVGVSAMKKHGGFSIASCC